MWLTRYIVMGKVLVDVKLLNVTKVFLKKVKEKKCEIHKTKEKGC